MNYKESREILEKVKETERILVNCHCNPDPDSIGSALAMKKVLEGMGKKVKVVCPTNLDENVNFLDGYDEIGKNVDFKDFDFGFYDLLITLDSSDWGQALGSEENKPKTPTIVVDHHATNVGYGDINLIDRNISSCAEILYLVFQDWGCQWTIASEDLLTGILGDTGGLRYPNTGVKTLQVVADLASHADMNKVNLNLFHSLDVGMVKAFGELLEDLIVEEDNFVWVAKDYNFFDSHGKPVLLKEFVANNFIQAIKDSEFGIVMLETAPGHLGLSLRSRGNFDVSKIALELGGGGHKAAAGATVEANFDEAVKKVLSVAKKYAANGSY